MGLNQRLSLRPAGLWKQLSATGTGRPDREVVPQGSAPVLSVPVPINQQPCGDQILSLHQVQLRTRTRAGPDDKKGLWAWTFNYQ